MIVRVGRKSRHSGSGKHGPEARTSHPEGLVRRAAGPPVRMILVYVSIPFMVLALAIAVVPLALSMWREARRGTYRARRRSIPPGAGATADERRSSAAA
jgi:hypothetical protein